MKLVNLYEAKTHLSRIVDEAVAGESIVLARAGKPLVKLVPVRDWKPSDAFGMAADRVFKRYAGLRPIPA
ncbi:MAG: type II toxin-antitoxin system prevent-host-death family antitoxin [Candidatus Cybelea sp.]